MKLLVVTVNKNDSTSFYRANGVLGDLKKQMPLEITSINYTDMLDWTWATFIMFDVIFMQRPFREVGFQIAQFCRNLNIPLWIDYDDNLLDIPKDNKSYAVYGNDIVKKNIIETIKLANVVTVSTNALKEVLKAHNPNIRVIPNAFNDHIFNYRSQTIRKRGNLMLWRGSDTHNLDIYTYKDQINEMQSLFTNCVFAYCGFNPFFINETSNKRHFKTIDPIQYFKQIYGWSPMAMQVPLADSIFNRCKSNIAWIEGSFAGAVCLVPDWEEWQMPGTVRYSNPAEYGEKMKLLLNNNFNYRKYNDLSWEYIMDNLTLSKVNGQRIEILKGLL